MLEHATPAKDAEPPSLGRGGRPLDAAVRDEAEVRLGYEFARVRVATGPDASDAADRLGARAFTIGERIALNASAPALTGDDGRKLILHELAHVAQAYDGLVSTGPHEAQRASRPGDALERDAAARLAAPPAEAVRSAPALGPSGLALRQDAGTSTPDAGPKPAPTTTPTKQPPAPPPPVTATPAAGAVSQKLYDDAVAYIASRSTPLFDVLKLGRVGSAVALPSVSITAPPGGKLTGVDFEFSFELIVGGVSAGALAQFDNLPPADIGTPTRPKFSQKLPIHIQAPPPKQVNPELRLSEELFHEGIHLMLARDRVLDGLAPTSPFLGERAKYGAAARASAAFAGLESGMVALLKTRRPAAAVSKPAQAADEAIDEVIDERFALDRQRTLYPGALLDNGLIATAYVPQALVNQLVPDPAKTLAADPAVAALIKQMKDVLDAIPFPTTTTGASVGTAPPKPTPSKTPVPVPTPKP